MSGMEKRSCGLDIYRIMAMVMITLLHLLNQHCGLLDAALPPGKFFTGCFLEYACFAGVNCFALLTGYFFSGKDIAYDRKFLGRIFSFWGRMIIWWWLLWGICRFFLLPENTWMSIQRILECFFPAMGAWWYISAYCGLLVFIPLLNKGLRLFSGRERLILSGILFILFSVLPVITGSEGFLGVDDGYSTVWLMVCFVYGAVLRGFLPEILRIKHLNKLLMLIIVLTILLPWGFHILELHPDVRRFMCYNSPFCILEAAALFILCVQIDVKPRRVSAAISWISANSLGIYLVQGFPEIWENLICRESVPEMDAWRLLWYIPALTALLAVSGIFGNVLTDGLFRRMIKIFYRGGKTDEISKK